MDDRDVRRVFRQVRPAREQEEAMLGRILDGEPENRGMRRIKKPVLVLAAALAVTVCAGAGIALRQAQTRYFDTPEEAWSALREAQGTDAPRAGVYLPREEDRDFPDLVPWDLQAEMSHMDQVTAHAFGSPEDGWTEMCSGRDSYRTYSLYQADTLAGLSEFWPVEAPDFTWLDETYLPLPGGHVFSKSEYPRTPSGDGSSFSGIYQREDGAQIWLNWSFYLRRQVSDRYHVKDPQAQVEEYTTEDGMEVSIQWTASISGQSQFYARCGYGYASFSAQGCSLTPEELHALLDHMNLSALTHYQP